MIRAVVFDFNGVLVDDEDVHFELLRKVLADVGVELTERTYHEEYLGYDDRGCFEVALERAGLDRSPGRIAELIDRKAQLYAAWADEGLRGFPEAAATVMRLADRWPVSICSGALRREIVHALDRMGIAGLFCAIVAAEDASQCKPDPEGYLLALDAMRSDSMPDLEAGHCLVIEDSLAGIRSGKSAGMWVVAVPDTYSIEGLRAAGADAVAPRLADITPEWVEQLFRPEISP